MDDLPGQIPVYAAEISRRRPLHPEITEPMIERLVRAFYDRVRADPILAPVFAAVIPDDWEPHLQRMMAFWSSVVLMSGRYKGQPMQKHLRLGDVGPAHFARWLALFERTAAEICPPGPAAVFVGRAQHIARSFQLAMFSELTPVRRLASVRSACPATGPAPRPMPSPASRRSGS